MKSSYLLRTLRDFKFCSFGAAEMYFKEKKSQLMQHPFPVCIIQREKQENALSVILFRIFDQECKINLYLPHLTNYYSLLTVFIMMNSIDALLQAAEYIERCERGMRNKWQDLPDELILKISSYFEVKDLICFGQVSKRTRNISRDRSLWVTANLEEKTVKIELLELILSKGCKILNISDSTIVGSLSSKIESQLKVLNLSQSYWELPIQRLPGPVDCLMFEDFDVLEQLIWSCCSLQQLEMQGLCITPKMVASICKNGKTLQALNLRDSFVYESTYPYDTSYTVLKSNIQAIIKCCQELKELDLNFFNEHVGLPDIDLEFLARNITPNVEKLNLRNHGILDDQVKILLSRCDKIKTLNLEAYFMSDVSLTYIRKYLNFTLEELSLVDDGTGTEDGNDITFTGFLELKSMPKLKVLYLYHEKFDCEKIQNLRQHLPHMKISHTLCVCSQKN